MKRALTTYAAVCLLTSGLLCTSTSVTMASSSQSINRPTHDASHTPVRPKPADAKSVTAKSSSQEASIVKVTPKKDAPGKRFWGRIMDHFREIHSAEKKPK